MIALVNLLDWFASVFDAHGAHHAAIGAVSNHLGWVTTHHWLVRICRIGTRGCHL